MQCRGPPPQEHKMANKIILAGTAGLLVVLVVAGGFLWEGPEFCVQDTRDMMDTWVTIMAYDKDEGKANDAIEAAYQRMKEISSIASRFDNSTEVWELNTNGTIEDPSPEFLEMMEMSVHYWNITDGAFDITIMPMLDLWGERMFLFKAGENNASALDNGQFDESMRMGFANIQPGLYELNTTIEVAVDDQGENWTITSNWQRYYVTKNGSGLDVSTNFWNLPHWTQQHYINQTMPLIGSDKITIEEDRITLEEGMMITLDGIAKGYAVDEALKVLAEHNIKSGLVNAGGDIATLGTKPEGLPWVIGLRNPENYEEILLEISFSDGEAIATSGNYIRYFNTSARTGHIMDPSTGRSSEGASSSTIVAKTCAEADILATAAYVLGTEEGINVVETLPGVEALLLGYENPRDVFRSSGISQYEDQS